MNTYKPNGYSSVSPYVIVADAMRWMNLLRDLFGATELSRYERPDGGILHAELQIDDSVIMLSEATADYPANQFMLHVYVPDALATYTKALELGCKPLQEPVQKDDPDLRGMFEDFAGHVWAVGTHLGEGKG